MNNLDKYNKIMEKLKGALEKYNRAGDINIDYNICRKYGFEQISRVILDEYIVFYVVYNTDGKITECDIILKDDESGYMFIIGENNIIKLKNTVSVSYDIISDEDYNKYFEYFEKGMLNKNKELIEKAYSILDKYF